MPWEDVLDHIRRLDVSAADLARWEATAARLKQ